MSLQLFNDDCIKAYANLVIKVLKSYDHSSKIIIETKDIWLVDR